MAQRIDLSLEMLIRPGIQQEMADVIRDQLEERIGEFPQDVTGRLENAHAETLRQWSRR